MSLRDQLVAKGLASKKDRRRANQSLRDKRKKGQGKRRKGREVRAEADAQREAQQAELMDRRASARRDTAKARALYEHRQSVFRLIHTNVIRSRGPIRFHHRTLDGKRLRSVSVAQSVAASLRKGHAAIVGFDHGGEVEYHIVSAGAAVDLAELAPEAVCFHVRDTTGLPDPAEEFWIPDQDIDLRPHRALPRDLERLASS